LLALLLPWGIRLERGSSPNPRDSQPENQTFSIRK